MLKRYFDRLTKSARGEAFNPLTYPFLMATFAYGIGFAFLHGTGTTEESSLYLSMAEIHEYLPMAWGILAILTILVGVYFLLFNKPPAGKTSGIVGFMLWTCAALVYIIDGVWLLLFAVAIPNMIFWFWQYLSLSQFRREDRADARSLRIYDLGGYDNIRHPRKSKIDREDNRGVEEQ